MDKKTINFSLVYSAIVILLVVVTMSSCSLAGSKNQNSSATNGKTPTTVFAPSYKSLSAATATSSSTQTINISWIDPKTMYTLTWADVVSTPSSDGAAVMGDDPSTPVTVYGQTTGTAVKGNTTWYHVSDKDSSPLYIAGALLSDTNPNTSVTSPDVPQAPVDTGKVILVDLTTQHLYAYQDNALVKDFLIASGRPSLETPIGTFTVLDKKANDTFYSPWPPGDPNYYPPVFVPYALKLTDSGIYLMAAPWREAYNDFGPGTQYPHKLSDGSQAIGTHGCIATTTAQGAWYYNWASIGMTVIISY